MVEVFKTNINCVITANEVANDLCKLYPNYKINFHLEDCDRIMRIEAENIAVAEIVTALQELSIRCEILI